MPRLQPTTVRPRDEPLPDRRPIIPAPRPPSASYLRYTPRREPARPACHDHRGRHRAHATPPWLQLVERLLFGVNHRPVRRAIALLLAVGLALSLIMLAGAVGAVLVCLSAVLMAALRLVDAVFTRGPQF
ncbi:hypothetical protein [Amycolatopsis minnesotensis]|uniref:hypothetical protein n=1 Tax=Amycolatopsis minnesotensis TaxID=337894 RepID=UPI0031D0CB84